MIDKQSCTVIGNYSFDGIVSAAIIKNIIPSSDLVLAKINDLGRYLSRVDPDNTSRIIILNHQINMSAII